MKKCFKSVGFVILYYAIFVLWAYLFLYQFGPWLGSFQKVAEFIGPYFYMLFPIFMVFTIFTIYFVLKFRGKNFFEVVNFSKISLKNVIAIAVSSVIMGLFTLHFCSVPFITKSLPGLTNYLSSADFYGVPAFAVILMVLATVIPEEIIFRGLVYKEMRESTSVIIAVAVSAVVYGLTNVILNSAFSVGVFATFVGVAYALPYIWTKSIWSSILVQVFSFVAIYFPRKWGYGEVVSSYSGTTVAIITVVCFAGIIASLMYVYKINSNKCCKKGCVSR